MLKKIATIGPESTGKSWLANKLAIHFNTNKVDEFARDFFMGKEYKYSIEDLLFIAKKQVENESVAALSSSNILFCDTELLVMKIWAQEVFGKVPEWILENIKLQNYDLFLLCYPDIKWENDRLRNNNENRDYIYGLFVKELEYYSCNYCVIKGVGMSRLTNAISCVDELLK